MALPSVALPGQLLGSTDNYLPGPGTHIYQQQIYASIAGPVISSPWQPSRTPSIAAATAAAAAASRPRSALLLSIPSPNNSSNNNNSSSTEPGGAVILPEVDAIVLARITRSGPRFATCEILAVNDTVCRDAFQGQIRREDVRATEKDTIRMEHSFRVGDVVRGVVIGLGDQSNYYIATHCNALGVVLARSSADEGGRLMCPVSWREFWDPVTGRRERRKVAKPF